ncbi:MAG: acyl-CoA dehydrogenase family protein [Blastococcus sp.]
MTQLAPDIQVDDLLGEITRLRPELLAVAAGYEDEERFPRDWVLRLADRGAIAAGLPRPYGAGVPSEDYARMVESIAAGWLTLAEIVQLQVLCGIGLTRYGCDRLRAEYVPRIISGEWIGGNCFSEPESGSDLGRLQSTATRRGDGWILDGQKAWVGHGPVASFFNVYARTGGPGLTGISCFLVHADTPGVHVGAPLRKMGARSLPTCPVTFDGVRVEGYRLLGRVNRGMIVGDAVFRLGRLGIAACAVGLSQAAVDHAVAYAKRRRQFGRPVFEFQGVSGLLADMSTSTEAARQLVRHAGRCRDSDRDAVRTLAQAKLFATETAMRVTTDAVQVLGAYGYDCDQPVERWMREAKLLQIIEGTSQIQRVTIADQL